MNFEYTVIIEQKVSIGLQLQKRIKISSLYNLGKHTFNYLFIFPREEAWLHRNLYHNSIKGIVILLRIFLFVQLFIPAALHMGNLDRAEILRWTLAAQTNKDN